MDDKEYVKSVNERIRKLVQYCQTHGKHSYDLKFYEFTVVEIANRHKLFKISPTDGSIVSQKE